MASYTLFLHLVKARVLHTGRCFETFGGGRDELLAVNVFPNQAVAQLFELCM